MKESRPSCFGLIYRKHRNKQKEIYVSKMKKLDNGEIVDMTRVKYRRFRIWGLHKTKRSSSFSGYKRQTRCRNLTKSVYCDTCFERYLSCIILFCLFVYLSSTSPRFK